MNPSQSFSVFFTPQMLLVSINCKVSSISKLVEKFQKLNPYGNFPSLQSLCFINNGLESPKLTALGILIIVAGFVTQPTPQPVTREDSI